MDIQINATVRSTCFIPLQEGEEVAIGIGIEGKVISRGTWGEDRGWRVQFVGQPEPIFVYEDEIQLVGS